MTTTVPVRDGTDTYEITVSETSQLRCNCKSASRGWYCKHLLMALDSADPSLVLSHAPQLEAARALLDDTQRALSSLRAKEAEHKAAIHALLTRGELSQLPEASQLSLGDDLSYQPPERNALLLSAQFRHGYAQGWYFAVPKEAATALSIKEAQRKIKGQNHACWVQGRAMNFHPGDTFWTFRSRTRSWAAALRDTRPQMRLGVQVRSATAASIETDRRDVITSADGVMVYHYSAGADTPHAQRVQQYTVHQESFARGRVEFDLFLLQGTTPQRLAQMSCDQEQFAHLLQSGWLETKTSRRHITEEAQRLITPESPPSPSSPVALER